MVKSVLGNDPFVRGAALRTEVGQSAPVTSLTSQPVKLQKAPPQASSGHAQDPSTTSGGLMRRPATAKKSGVTPLRAMPPLDPKKPSASGAGMRPPLPLHSREAFRVALKAIRSAFDRETLRAVGLAMGTLLHAPNSRGGKALPDIYGMDSELLARLAPLREFLYAHYWRVSVEGAAHLPSGPALIVANHAGAVPLDGPVLAEAIHRERPELTAARWLLEDQVFHAPFLGTFFNRLGALRACPENAARLLGEGRPVLVFPEGIQAISKPFRDRYQLKRFGRGGFVKIALRTGVPVIPAAILGSEESLPLVGRMPLAALGLPYFPLTPLGPLPLPSKWSIRFGAPLDLGGRGGEAADDIAAVQELTEATRQSIESMLQSMAHSRRSVFAG